MLLTDETKVDLLQFEDHLFKHESILCANKFKRVQNL